MRIIAVGFSQIESSGLLSYRDTIAWSFHEDNSSVIEVPFYWRNKNVTMHSLESNKNYNKMEPIYGQSYPSVKK